MRNHEPEVAYSSGVLLTQFRPAPLMPLVRLSAEPSRKPQIVDDNVWHVREIDGGSKLSPPVPPYGNKEWDTKPSVVCQMKLPPCHGRNVSAVNRPLPSPGLVGYFKRGLLTYVWRTGDEFTDQICTRRTIYKGYGKLLTNTTSTPHHHVIGNPAQQLDHVLNTAHNRLAVAITEICPHWWNNLLFVVPKLWTLEKRRIYQKYKVWWL